MGQIGIYIRCLSFHFLKLVSFMAVHPCGAALAVCLLIPAASWVPSIQNQLLGFMAWLSQGSLPHDPEAIDVKGRQ